MGPELFLGRDEVRQTSVASAQNAIQRHNRTLRCGLVQRAFSSACGSTIRLRPTFSPAKVMRPFTVTALGGVFFTETKTLTLNQCHDGDFVLHTCAGIRSLPRKTIVKHHQPNTHIRQAARESCLRSGKPVGNDVQDSKKSVFLNDPN